MTEAPLLEVEDLTRALHRGRRGGARARRRVASTSSAASGWPSSASRARASRTLMNILGCLDTPTAGRYRIRRHRTSPALSDDAARRPAQPRDRLRLPDLPAACRARPRSRTSSCRSSTAACRARERRERAEAALDAVGLAQPHAPPAERAVRRPAAARRHRARAGGRAVAPPRRRAHRQPRLAPPARRSCGSSASCTGAGHTIVLVTHEPTLAARCPRAIRLSDGQVVADGPGREVARSRPPGRAGTRAGAPRIVRAPGRAGRGRPHRARLARRHRLRTRPHHARHRHRRRRRVIAIIAIIQGLDASFEAQVASLGTNTLYVSEVDVDRPRRLVDVPQPQALTLAQWRGVERESRVAVAASPPSGSARRSAHGTAAAVARWTCIGVDGASTSRIARLRRRRRGASSPRPTSSSTRPVAVLGADVADVLFPRVAPAEILGQRGASWRHPFQRDRRAGAQGAVPRPGHGQAASLIPFETLPRACSARSAPSPSP